MKTLIRASALALALATASAPAAIAQTPAAAENMFRATTLNLSAYGESKIAPDMATISLGVMTQASTAQEAMRQNAERMSRVVEALRRGGVPAKDIQTSGLSLSPQYRYVENQPPQLTGYQASNMVTVTVNELSRLGQAVDATVNAGANQVHGVSFGLKDPAFAENQAREAAVRALQAKAELYARATGHRIVRLVTLNEGGGANFPVPPPAPMMEAAQFRGKAADTSISPGELRVRVDISGMHELAR